MNRPDDRVRLGRQEAKKVIRRFAFPDLPNRRPPRPDAGKKGERAAIVEREPYRRTGAVRQNLVLSEAGKGDDAATFDAEPSPQWDDLTLRMLVTPGSVFLPAMAKVGDGMPQRAIASSRTPSPAVRTIGAE